MRGILTALAITAVFMAAVPAHADVLTDIKAVEQAERDFAADTAKNGFHRGFIAWSTDDAIGFLPKAGNFHKTLADALAADPSLADKPTPLRWRPFYVGVANSGDLAFDLGTWTLEGSDKAGWFFTIWEKQADGGWKWSLDGGAGDDTPDNLPGPDDALSLVANTDHVHPNGLAEGLGRDDAFNVLLAQKPYADIYAGIGGTRPTIAADGVPPYVQGYWPWPSGDGAPPPPEGAEAKMEARRQAVIAARPEAGLTWTRDGSGVSKSGDFVYTYGRATAKDGTYRGHYVRVWQKLTERDTSWLLVVDLFHK
jgi:ketosteroid isomerase-like protein